MELFDAVDAGSVSEVRRLVARGADVNVQNDDGWRPLHWAARGGHVEVVAALVELGADVHVQDDGGLTPLHHAADEGHVEVVAALVELGADVNVPNNGGWRPLHYAAREGLVEVVSTLVELGADVNVQDDDGMRPLHHAAEEGHVEVAIMLVQLGADVQAVAAGGYNPLHLASTAAVATLLLEAGADLHRRNHDGNTPLFEAIHQRHSSAVTALVQAGARPEASDGEWWTTLLVGAVTGDEAALTELVAASEELTRRMNENGHFARTAVQLAELSTHARRQEVLAALTVAPP
jgi:ankyrin repeat protein